MGVAGPEVSAGVRQLVEERDIDYYPKHQVTGIDPETKTMSFSNGVETRFDFLVYIPPHVAPPVVTEAGLTGQSGWVPVDRNTMETEFSGVYAIGDVTGIPLAMGLPLPKAGVFAHGEGEAVASHRPEDHRKGTRRKLRRPGRVLRRGWRWKGRFRKGQLLR